MQKSVANNNDDVVFIPLGGSGEIGANLNLYGHAGKWLMVDCGVSFGDKLPGIELTLPDPSFAASLQHDLVGIVITHGHEDHIGALQYVWHQLQCPIFATPFTAALIRSKMGDAPHSKKLRIIEMLPGDTRQLGPFKFEFVAVTHSIPDSVMVLITTGIGHLLHTGDWKFDDEPLLGHLTDYDRLAEIGREGLLALVGDSTNALLSGHSGSEGDIRGNLVDLVSDLKGRVVITCFASNVARLRIAAEAARKAHRELCFVGRSLWRIFDAAQHCNYWKGLPLPAEADEVDAIPSQHVLYVATGCQGEERAALSRMAMGEHPHVHLGAGDNVIFSSREIPGNEREIARIQNLLIERGVRIVTVDDLPVHVSGHPCRDELTKLYQTTRPHIIIPVHGELRHQLANAEIAKQCQVRHTIIPNNGDVIRITKEGVEKVAQVPAPKLGLDGVRLVPVNGDTLRERAKIAESGVAVVSVLVDKRQQLARQPQITLLGLGDEGETGRVVSELIDNIRDVFEGQSMKDRSDDVLLKTTLAGAVRRHCMLLYGKKPVTDVHITRTTEEVA